jgi:hypothetical protein
MQIVSSSFLQFSLFVMASSGSIDTEFPLLHLANQAFLDEEFAVAHSVCNFFLHKYQIYLCQCLSSVMNEY